jgi:hypothetical protein
MADFANKRCPRCGKRPADVRLVQCPDCLVAFEYESAPAAGLTPAQVSAVARQVLGSWKLWLAVVALVGAATGGVLEFVNLRTQGIREAEQVDAKAMEERVSEGISNQIATQFQEPQVEAAIEQAATQKPGEILTNAVWASLEEFRAKLKAANEQLAGATNDLAMLSNNIHTAQAALAQMTSASPDDPALLTLVDKTITHDGTNYDLTLFFRTTNTKPVGAVELMAGTYRQTARILGFTARNVDQADPPVMNDAGDAARLKFTVSHVDSPVVVELALSAPTIVKIVGDELAEELTLPVAVDQMQLPVVNR